MGGTKGKGVKERPGSWGQGGEDERKETYAHAYMFMPNQYVHTRSRRCAVHRRGVGRVTKHLHPGQIY